MIVDNRFHLVSQWLEQLDKPDVAFYLSLIDVYSARSHGIRERLFLIRRVLMSFLERFGDRPVRLFRSPGRINLRGMHIDTHGGGLNLMSHQRETVLVAAVPDAESADEIILANIDPHYEETCFSAKESVPWSESDIPWASIVQRVEVQDAIVQRRGYWGHYIRGCALAIRHRYPERPFHGFLGMVGSDIPQGAALSSSAALCVATTLAFAGVNDIALDSLDRILIARDAEWYTGSRCGLSDQAAMVLGRRGGMVHVALYPPSPRIDSARYIHFDEHNARILVINSFTRRSISGAELAQYTTNRFAYSLALEILRQEMQRSKDPSLPPALIESMDRLSHIHPGAFADVGGQETLIRLIMRIPEALTLAEIQGRYRLPELTSAYQHYFGGVDEAFRPQQIGLRGPLLFGIAESERARLFPQLVEARRWAEAGALMNAGHEGDRVVNQAGLPVQNTVDDAALESLVCGNQQLAFFPGAYGASSTALDLLVDTARKAGALGSCLTGAGIAGTVLALCSPSTTDVITAALHACLASSRYMEVAQLEKPLSPGQIAQSVLPNVSVAGACELIW